MLSPVRVPAFRRPSAGICGDTMSSVTLGEQPSISASLRDATAQAHERAEGSDFIGDLMSGRLDAQAYRTLAAQLYFVTEALGRSATASTAPDEARPSSHRSSTNSCAARPASPLIWTRSVSTSTLSNRFPPWLVMSKPSMTPVTIPPTSSHHHSRGTSAISAVVRVIKSRMIAHYGIDKTR